MNRVIRPLMLVLALIALGVAPSLAQGVVDFEAEVDCDGIFSPGDTVPLTLDFTNQTSQMVEVALRLTLDVPNLGERELLDRSINLAPNQTFTRPWQLRLPLSAPNGEYTVTLTADSMSSSTFDTCSFHVQ